MGLLAALPARIAAQDTDAFTPDQLDKLLAQVLLAATFPDQIDEAARYMRGGGDPNAIDAQAWDVSVKAVAHYPQVLYMMADKLDWTTALGQAYVNQSTDVLASIQRLRQEAYAVGNLTTTPDEQVVDMDGYIDIWPAQAQYICVPIYDPSLIYFGRGLGSGIRFGARLPIGAWLNFDFDWVHHRIYYHGWSAGVGWITRSRQFVKINNIYVNDKYRNYQPNHSVVTRTVNRSSLNRYNAVHRQASFTNAGSAGRGAPAPPAQNREVKNKILERNVNTNDARIDQFRGQTSEPAAVNRPAAAAGRGQSARVEPARVEPARVEPTHVEPSRPAPQPVVREPERPVAPAFTETRSAFTPAAASDRGQESRAEMSRPAPESRPASPPPESHGGKH
jgi:hypothetical protein